MKNKYIFAFIMLIGSMWGAQAQTNIDARQTAQMLKKGSAVQLIDVRTPGEWNETGVIAGAKKMNYNAPDFQSQIERLDKKKPVIVYCAAGGRSAAAAAQMTKMGFKQVYNYAGGMSDWQAKGNKTVKSAGNRNKG